MASHWLAHNKMYSDYGRFDDHGRFAAIEFSRRLYAATTPTEDQLAIGLEAETRAIDQSQNWRWTVRKMTVLAMVAR